MTAKCTEPKLDARTPRDLRLVREVAFLHGWRLREGIAESTIRRARHPNYRVQSNAIDRLLMARSRRADQRRKGPLFGVNPTKSPRARNDEIDPLRTSCSEPQPSALRFPSTLPRLRRTVHPTETPAQSVRAFNSPLSPGSLSESPFSSLRNMSGERKSCAHSVHTRSDHFGDLPQLQCRNGSYRSFANTVR
jgi:hypothetical protein